MKIFQIVIGEVPVELVPCIESVIAFAARNGHSYWQITEVPEVYAHIESMRVVSDYMRVDELCKDPENCYFDWDVMLDDGFTMTDSVIPKVSSIGDTIMYSGNVSFWENIRSIMGSIDENKYEVGRIFHVLSAKPSVLTIENIIPRGKWSHLGFSRKTIA